MARNVAVLGVLGIFGVIYWASQQPVLTQTTPEKKTAAVATAASVPGQPFVATVSNEQSWKPDVLPVAWPQFTKLPDQKPLPTKPAKFKIDNATAFLSRWQAYQAGTSKDLPSNADADLAIRYLLSIARDDPAFPDAWAIFIKLRQADLAVSRERAMVDGRKLLDKQAEERKRTAKDRGVNIGMTQADVLASQWGKPKSVNTTITAGGKHEQWVYHSGNYLYFQNGTLTSIQTGR